MTGKKLIQRQKRHFCETLCRRVEKHRGARHTFQGLIQRFRYLLSVLSLKRSTAAAAAAAAATLVVPLGY